MAAPRHPAGPRSLTAGAVFSREALWQATRRAARGKRHRAAVARFALALEDVLSALHRALVDGTWRPSLPRLMSVRDPKERTISVLPFADRVVHQALCAALEPRVERRLISDTYACRAGLGTHAALRRARAWSRSHAWSVHLDVARFFPSVDHAVVRAQLARDVPEPWLRALCERILRAGVTASQRWHFPGDDLFAPLAREVGLPLGNLTSQLWANRVLDPVDHLVKDRLRVRAYLRYMDDMLIFHHDRRALEDVARAIEEACLGLRLRLHPWEARPTEHGVSFVGYRVLPDHVRVRRSTVARAEHRLREKVRAAARGELAPEAVWDSLRATSAHLSHADSWRLRTEMLRRLGLLYEPFDGR